MAEGCIGELGEVEQKLVALVEEVFNDQTEKQMDEDGHECITKEQCKVFIKQLMQEADEEEAWSDKEFNECYQEFDYDGNGTISKSELT